MSAQGRALLAASATQAFAIGAVLACTGWPLVAAVVAGTGMGVLHMRVVAAYGRACGADARSAERLRQMLRGSL